MSGLILEYGLAAGIFVTAWVVLWAAKKAAILRLEHLSKKTKTDLDDALVSILDTINPVVLGAASLAFAVRFADVPPIVITTVSGAFLIALVYQASIGAARIVDIALLKTKGKRGDGGRKVALSLLSGAVKVAIWVVGGLLVLSNLGVDITSLVAGLGIGGVAVALALQNILSDLFSSFAIYFDKPFEVGDFIIVGEHLGTVEKIGIKTTRLRSLQGEEIVISNAELTSARIQNFRKLKERRVAITFGVLYETPHELLKEIPGMVRSIIEHDEKGARLDRVHLAAYGASSIDFELVYYALTNNFIEHMDTQERILFAIKEAFDTKGIAFAYPTQTVYVKK